MTFRLPGIPWLGDGLIGSSLILIELDDACRFGLLVGEVNQSFFSGVSTSYTVTVPLLRLRNA
jgi:hypothetical protein